MREAMHYQVFPEKLDVQCMLCPHRCVILSGKAGKCSVRKNEKGSLISINYGQLTAINLDPVEKKPLFHFMPGTTTLSIGSFGCNLRCPYCQNYHISMGNPGTRNVTPEILINRAIEMGIPSISYTYNEPTVYYEYVYETAKLAKQKGLSNIMVTNGYIEEAPLKELLPFIDAMNVDLKAFSEKTYQSFCGGDLDTVLRSISSAHSQCHIEITTLLVTDMHKLNELERMFQWISGLSPQIPLHLSRYFPSHQYHASMTPKSWMEQVKKTALKYLDNVYLGNI